jgi:hypothetical protein
MRSSGRWAALVAGRSLPKRSPTAGLPRTARANEVCHVKGARVNPPDLVRTNPHRQIPASTHVGLVLADPPEAGGACESARMKMPRPTPNFSRHPTMSATATRPHLQPESSRTGRPEMQHRLARPDVQDKARGLPLLSATSAFTRMQKRCHDRSRASLPRRVPHRDMRSDARAPSPPTMRKSTGTPTA